MTSPFGTTVPVKVQGKLGVVASVILLLETVEDLLKGHDAPLLSWVLKVTGFPARNSKLSIRL